MSAKPVTAPVEPQPLKNYKLHIKVNVFQFTTTVSATDITSAFELGYQQLKKLSAKKANCKVQIISAEELA